MSGSKRERATLVVTGENTGYYTRGTKKAKKAAATASAVAIHAATAAANSAEKAAIAKTRAFAENPEQVAELIWPESKTAHFPFYLECLTHGYRHGPNNEYIWKKVESELSDTPKVIEEFDKFEELEAEEPNSLVI